MEKIQNMKMSFACVFESTVQKNGVAVEINSDAGAKLSKPNLSNQRKHLEKHPTDVNLISLVF